MILNEFSLLTDDDLYYFNEGTHYRIYRKLGAHLAESGGIQGVHFAVWAPNAERVCVMGDFNHWDKTSCPLSIRGQSGVWEGFVPGIGKGTKYKYQVYSRYDGYQIDKADPLAFYAEVAPQNASIVWDLTYEWGDQNWMETRHARNGRSAPISIYELHLGSWRRSPDHPERFFGYRNLAPILAEYVKQQGFTHVEFLPIMEHPYYPSWGYQSTGYFSPTSRYGSPQDFMYLVDFLHQNDIGVILDWVPSHFPTDGHGLGYFDGTHLYEHADPRLGYHPEWTSFIFNYGRHEVHSFLLSSAMFWLDHYHADGLRVDGVASMLYRDYARHDGEWLPNQYGGKENIEAIDFLRQLNSSVYQNYPDVQTIAEESTAWPMVSRPADSGGLGFGMKWDMGWMHDTLKYLALDPLYRSHHQGELTFRMIYAFTENFILPLSHDEVVHRKGSLLRKMPGDDPQKFAGLRLLFGYMYSQPGKKLIFMGGEFGQWDEWSEAHSLDWHLLQYAPHQGVQKWVEDLNRFYRSEPALHELDCEPAGFEWIKGSDAAASTLCFLRKAQSTQDLVLVVCNFTPVIRTEYRVGAPRGGLWREALNGDAVIYGGSGQGNTGTIEAEELAWDGFPYSLSLTLPPLAVVLFTSRETP
ncbi:MAG: 1,4-alpha-glucan branching protein GlgB [Terriglobia bacterium]